TLLNFGEKGGAVGDLVGEEGRGLAAMFHMMNEARIGVGLGATMLGYTGYLHALEYARSRPQGRPIGPAGKDPAQPQVRIIEHADVKRMLLAQKAYAEGALGLNLYCARLIDEERTAADEQARRDATLLLDILTPIAKSWPSEWCLEANSLAIQVHGGYGYTRDFPVEQHWRDNRLNMIHEGTHGIQGLDLLGRKVVMQDGAALKLLARRIRTTIDASLRVPALAPQARQLSMALQALESATRAAWVNGLPEEALANATPYLQAFGHTVLAWLWLDVGQVCGALLDAASSDTPSDTPSDNALHGKLAAMRYFFAYELPKIDAWLLAVASRQGVCRDMQDHWF
ncbi:MAG: acyl-CoA dehydrogenase, partial [Variovorax sp.]